MTIGRPSKYNVELGEQICSLLEQGVSLLQISRREDMPSYGTIWRWADAPLDEGGIESFQKSFRRARQYGTHFLADECLEISDDSSGDIKMIETRNGPVEAMDGEFVARSRIRVDTRLRLIGMWNKKDYGDKKAVELTGAGGGPIKTITSDMTPKEAADAYAATIRGED